MRSNKVMCYLFAMLPILLNYGWGSITFADITVLVLVIYTVVRRGFCIKKGFLIVSCFFIIHPILLFSLVGIRNNLYDMFGTSFRLAYYIFATGILINQFRNNINIIKAIRCVAVVCSFYAVLQFVMANMFGILVSAYLPFLPHRGVLDAQTQEWIDYGWLVRPRSFFSEPSTFSIYLLLALSLELFVLKTNLRIIVILIGGIFISVSSLGIVCLLFLLFVFTYRYLKVNRFVVSRKKMLFVEILFLLLLGISIKMNLFEIILEHITAGGKGLMSTTRFADIKTAFSTVNAWKTLFLGNGMQDIQEYLPGWVRVYYCNGIIGLLLYVGLFYKSIKSVSKKNRIIMLLFGLINIGGEAMMGLFFIHYFVMNFYNCKENPCFYNGKAKKYRLMFVFSNEERKKNE